MTRLESEWQRLYRPHGTAGAITATDKASLIDAEGQVRAMVLTLARPADWVAFSVVWHAVQSELSLPAPAIAVSGTDAYQLWFSLVEAIPVPQAHAFLEALRARYLSHIEPARIGLLPAVDAQANQPAWYAGMVPAQQAQADQWSAFVAPDLAPVFAQTPWLDMPPSPEGQADLLSRLQCIKPQDWQMAWARLQPEQALVTSASASSALLAHTDATEPGQDPRRFLIKVMNDDSVALALRIEAAKALLPYTPT